MGDFGDERNALSADAFSAPHALVGLFLRELDAACHCTVALHGALSMGDRGQLIAVMHGLHGAWSRASARIAQLESVSSNVERFAREALETSRVLAFEPLARAKEFLVRRNLLPDLTLDVREYD